MNPEEIALALGDRLLDEWAAAQPEGWLPVGESNGFDYAWDLAVQHLVPNRDAVAAAVLVARGGAVGPPPAGPTPADFIVADTILATIAHRWEVRSNG